MPLEVCSVMRVLVIEDDEAIARMIASGLRREGHTVQIASNGAEGLMYATTDSAGFHVLVLDVMLPKLNGFDLLAELRRREFNTPVLMLSALDSVDDRVRGLRGGADDYLIKPFAFDELLARLIALVRRAGGGSMGEPTRLSVGDLRLDRLSRTVHRGDAPLDLQPKEFALLEYFMSNPGQVLTKAMILERVWHWTFDPRTNVVDVLVFRLRNKLDRDSEPKLIHTLRGIGYVLRAT